MYLATVLRSRPSWRAMAETVRPCRCSSKIIMSSPRLTTVPLPPATGSSIGEKDATLAPRISLGAFRRADKTGECSKPTNAEDLTPAHKAFANQIRRRLPSPGDKWHLDEVCLMIAGQKHWLWRAVDQDGVVLDVLVQRRRD